MTSDYEAISAAHILDYGRRTELLEFVSDLYSDRTHFLYELLQNAEDAAASYVRFDLFPDRLEFSHDGRLFDTADVKSICAAVASTKEQAAEKIGKFGIGFKSVYALTATPEIHSGDEHFAIEFYVRPRATEPRPTRQANETLFVFPFNRNDEPADAIHGDIERGFSELEPTTLLFLRKISRVELSVGGASSVTLERAEESDGSATRIRLSTSDLGKATVTRHWLRFERAVASPTGGAQRVEVAFALRRSASDERLRIESLGCTNVVAYFPTDKPSYLGFFVQGPFRTTKARDNIRRHDEWNEHLIAEIGELIVSTLHDLKRLDLLDAVALDTLPLDPNQFMANRDLYPIFARVQAAMKTEELLPTASGSFVAAPRLALARGRGLSELLSGSQLASLLGTSDPIEWQAPAISQDQTPNLWRYLRESLGVELVDPDKITSRLTADFLASQTDDWITRLYKFLLPQRSARNSIRERPIVRLEDGSHVTPVDAAGNPKCFLPIADTDASLPTVRRSIAENPEAREFLVALGVPEIDLVTEVTEHVLPRYHAALDVKDDDAQHRHDLQQIRAALDSAVKSRRDQLMFRLRATSFLRATRFDGVATRYCPPTVYLRSPDLDSYFAGSNTAWYLDDDVELLGDLPAQLGVATEVRVIAGTPDRTGCISLRSEWGIHERGRDGFDPRFSVDGLKHALQQPTHERSRYIWNEILVPNRQHLAGEVETATRQDYTNGSSEHRLSDPAAIARAHPWLPGPDGEFVRPCDLDFDDLPADFIRDRSVAAAIDMRMPALVELSRTVGVSVVLMQRLRDDPQLAVEFEQFVAERSLAAITDAGNGEDDRENSSEIGPQEALAPTDAPEYLEALFTRPRLGGAADPEEADHLDRPVSNPALRRSRIREEILAQIDANRSAGKAFRRVPRKVWERKDSTVRHWLLSEYDGCCQICGYTFTKRDAERYFEGLSLLPFGEATWADRVGNVLCLCANCCARFQHGPVAADDVLGQIDAWQAHAEGGSVSPALHIRLGDEVVTVHYSERHFLDLQELLRAADDGDSATGAETA